MGLGDFKQLERELGLDTVEDPDSGSFTSAIGDLFGGFRTVAEEVSATAGTFADIKNSFENMDNSQTDKMRQDYQDIKQAPGNQATSSLPINKNQMVYLGVGAVALYLLFGGGK